MNKDKPRSLYKYGPWFVALGAALWGTESGWRIPLLDRFNSAVIVFWEHAILVVLFCPILFLNWQAIKKIPKSAWGYLLFSGIAGSAVGTVFYTEALRLGNKSVVNVLLSIQPLFSTFFACLIFKDKLSRFFIPLAFLAIVSGMLLGIEDIKLFSAGMKASSLLDKGIQFTLLCALCWGLSTVAGRGAMLAIPFAVGAALRFVIGFISIFVILLWQGKIGGSLEGTSSWLLPASAQQHLFATIALFLGLAIPSGGIPTFFYFLGLRYTRASVAGYFEMMQTLAALLVTWGLPVFFQKAFGFSPYAPSPLKIHQIVAGLVLLIAVIFIQREQSKVEKESPIHLT